MADVIPKFTLIDILAVSGLVLADVVALLAVLGSGWLLLTAGIETARRRPISKPGRQAWAWSLSGLIMGVPMTVALFVKGNTSPVGLFLRTDQYVIAALLVLAFILLLLRFFLKMLSQGRQPMVRGKITAETNTKV